MLDASGAYIGANATGASLAALNNSTMALHNVSGYRVATYCEFGQPGTLGTVDMGDFFQITLISLVPAGIDRIYHATIRGPDTIASPISGSSMENHYIAFTNGDHTTAYLGYLFLQRAIPIRV
jgi:hypothetical protein